MSTAFLEALHADPWAEAFVDLASLNASASEAIESNVREVRELGRKQERDLRSRSLVVLGPPGAGKTHLFARLRRKLGPRAVFVHVRPLVHAGMTPRFLLGEVVKQLGYASHGVTAMPQVHAMVGSLLAHLAGEDVIFSSAFLTEFESLSDEERAERLDRVVDQVLETWQEVDETYLRRLLQVPFAKTPAMRRSLLAWLSGRDCDTTQLARIGATASLSEEVAMSALQTLSVVAARGAPIVIVFDQLENLIDRDESGGRLLAYATLASELVDTIRGLVVVHMALDTEWSRGIEPTLNPSQLSRIVMRRELLSLPTARQREELLQLWIDQIPDRPSAFPWPFTEGQAARLCQRPGVTPRMLLIEFRKALNGEPLEDTESIPPEPIVPVAVSQQQSPGLAEEWEQRLAAARAASEEATEQRACLDPLRLTDGLLAAGRFLPGVQLAPIKGADAGQLRWQDGGEPLRIAILHQPHFKSLGAALKKLTGLAERERVVVVREQAHELLPTWKDTLAKRSALLATGRARWLWLSPGDAVSLLALDSFLQDARSGDVTDEYGRPLGEEAVAEWIRTTLNVPEWEVLRTLREGKPDVEEPEAEPEPRSGVKQAAPVRGGAALTLLRRLRIASVDRVVREAMRADPGATRASVIAELEGHPHEVRWFGRTILGVRVV